SADKLKEVLDFLVTRRLIGVDFSRGLVDVHPVIRGQIVQYILKQYEPGGNNDIELVEHVESTDDKRELMIRFLNQPDLEKRFQSLSGVLEGFEDLPAAQLRVLNILGRFFPSDRPGERPW